MSALQRLNHPSATSVYEEVHKANPRISRATVFRVLADEAADGHLLRLHINGTDDRFDITLGEHYHIRCRVCGRVDDVETEEYAAALISVTDAHGYTVESCDIGFTGICPHCRSGAADCKSNNS